METLFENEYELSKELYVELESKFYVKNRKKYRAFVLASALLTLALFLFSLTMKDFLWFSIFTFVMDALFWFMYFKAYLIYAGKRYKQIVDLNGGLPRLTNLFYDDKIVIKTQRSERTIYYDQISDVIETDDFYAPLVQKQSVLLLKDSFTKGDLESFKTFIKEKCPALR